MKKKKITMIVSPKIQVDTNGRPLFFPHRFLTRQCPYNEFPVHQLTLSTALGRPCSKFEMESRARPTAFEECNGLPSKDRTIEKKNRREERKRVRKVR